METQSSMALATSPSGMMPLIARMANVLVMPDAVFESVRTGKPSIGNWLAPTLLWCLMGVLCALIVYSQPAIGQRLREQREREVQAMVKSGRISESQADSAEEEMDRYFGPAFYMLTGSFKSVGGSFGRLFVVAVALWLLGTKLFDSSFKYGQALEVSGLAAMIPVLGALATMFLVVARADVRMTLGPILLVAEVDPANKLHAALATLNLPALWYVGVLSVGLAKLSGASLLKAGGCVFGLWFVFRLMLVGVGLGFAAL